MKNIAVLTCDITNSTTLNDIERRNLNDRIKCFVENTTKENEAEYLLYRGDSLQGVVSDTSKALKHAIYLKAYIKAFKKANSQRTTEVDIRISIGIGSIDFQGNSLLDSDGEAFQNSGRVLDTMKKKGRTLMLTTSDVSTNTKWDVILTLMEDVLEQWTILSAEVIWRLIEGWEDQKIQEDLKISQPAVSQRKKRAGWKAVKKMLDY